MILNDFNFSLPDDLIAKNPVEPRDNCRLLVLDRASKSIDLSRKFSDLVNYLGDGDVLVLNDSKVIPARIILDNGRAEVLLVRNISEYEWTAMVRPGKKFKPGTNWVLQHGVSMSVVADGQDGLKILRFELGYEKMLSYLDEGGKVPFPPYIGESSATANDYQTVYADQAGSAAAPTAGLHFTLPLLSQLKALGIQIEFVTLHIGPGTFRPVQVEDISTHKMHAEHGYIAPEVGRRLTRAIQTGKKIIAVGTTSVRVLESSFDQKSRTIRSGNFETDIFIYPGYKWNVVQGIITNFHLPKSSLLMLVSSFAGHELVLQAYKAAILAKFRFYSFGDAMFIY